MSFKDHFSGHSQAYARYRPGYPASLFDFLASLTATRDLALDCATGSGQAAIGLARHYRQVLACDASAAQLRSAQPHARVCYLGSLAEQFAVKTHCVDLLVVAQAVHWFDHERFNAEAARVLRPQGVVAAWTYDLARVNASVDACVQRFYQEEIGRYWPAERRYVESAYRDLPFPWEEIAAPAFEMGLRWDLDEFMGYVGTWSAVQRYIRATGRDPLPPLRRQIAAHWNASDEQPEGAVAAGGEADLNRGGRQRSVIWPLYLRLGRQTK